MALLTGLGALLGGASNTNAARTGTSSTTGLTGTSTTGSTGTSGTSSNTYTAPQQALQGQALGTISSNLQNGINLAPLETSGANSINQTYNSIGQNLNQTLASRGFGQSGAVGEGALQTQLGRAGAIGSMTSNLQGYAIQQQQSQLQDALQGAFTPTGSSNTGYSSTLGQNITDGSTNSAYTLPGSATAGALSGGVGGLLSSLNQAAALGGF
jgi:hypothetical protein